MSKGFEGMAQSHAMAQECEEIWLNHVENTSTTKQKTKRYSYVIADPL